MGGVGQAAVELLEEAAAIEDAMAYMEPPRWYQPIRHCLGYVLSNVTEEHAQAEQASPLFYTLRPRAP